MADWPVIDNMLASWRARIYELIPADWTFVGPIRAKAKGWTVAVRSPTGRVIDATGGDLQATFVELAEELVRLNLPRGREN